MYHRSTRRTAAPAGIKATAMRIGLIAVPGMLCTVLLLFAAAFTALHNDWGSIPLHICAYASCGIPALLCGIFAARSVARHKALCGVLSAVPILLLTGALSLIQYGKVGAGWGYAALTVLLCALLGAFLAVRTRSKKRKIKY